MHIQHWQKSFVLAVNKKFPKEFSPEQRLLALHRQVSDVSQTIQSGEFGGVDLNLRIASIFPDLFMLCEQHGVDLEKELPKALAWFNSNKPTSTR